MNAKHKSDSDEVADLKRRLAEAEAALKAAAEDCQNASSQAGAPRSMEAPKAGEAPFRAMAEVTSAGIFILREMIIRYANPAATMLTGYKIKELIGRPFWEVAHPAYRDALKQGGLRPIAENFPARFEIKAVTKGGQERWLDLTAGHIEYDGSPACVVTAFDITERDLAEKALQQAKETLEQTNCSLEDEIVERQHAQETAQAERQRFFDVLETLPAYLVLLTPDYHVPFANRFFRERFGEAHGRRCYEYLFGRTEPCEVCETYTVLKTMQPHHWDWVGPDQHNYDVFDFPFIDTDGSTIIMEMGIDITERKKAEAELRCHQGRLEELVGERTQELRIVNAQLGEEIAERRQAEEALRSSEARFRLALKNAPVSVAAQDRDLNFLWAYNQRTVDPRIVIGKTDTDIFPPEDAARLISLKRQVLETEQELREQLWITSGGKRVYIDLFLEPQRDESGQVIGLGIATVDLTPMKLAEDALAHSNKKLSEVLDSIQDDFYVLDRDWKFVFASRSFTSRIGKEPKDFVGNVIWDMFPKHVGTLLEENFRASMEKGEIRRFEIGGKYTDAWYRMDSFPSAEGITVLGTDITTRKWAEQDLQAANEELTRFNNAMVGRELRMVELKKEVNALCAKAGLPPRYPQDPE